MFVEISKTLSSDFLAVVVPTISLSMSGGRVCSSFYRYLQDVLNFPGAPGDFDAYFALVAPGVPAALLLPVLR